MTERLTPMRCPEGFTSIGEVMSNFDHAVAPGAEDRLAIGDCFGVYPGSNFFCTKVWYANGEFHAEVWRHGTHTSTESAATLGGLMTKISDQYGWN